MLFYVEEKQKMKVFMEICSWRGKIVEQWVKVKNKEKNLFVFGCFVLFLKQWNIITSIDLLNGLSKNLIPYEGNECS